MAIADADIEAFLRPSLATQSIDDLRKHFPRWRALLQALGITNVPSPLSTRVQDAYAANLIALMARQASLPEFRDASIEHHLRNLTGIRRWKV